jgi:hypothetical protein
VGQPVLQGAAAQFPFAQIETESGRRISQGMAQAKGWKNGAVAVCLEITAGPPLGGENSLPRYLSSLARAKLLPASCIKNKRAAARRIPGCRPVEFLAGSLVDSREPYAILSFGTPGSELLSGAGPFPQVEV